ncbi:armadillo-type protein, partial [Baffinella frigidus]
MSVVQQERVFKDEIVMEEEIERILTGMGATHEARREDLDKLSADVRSIAKLKFKEPGQLKWLLRSAIMEKLPTFADEAQTITFQRCLLDKCQEEFDRADRYDAKVRIGNITFIGELFVEGILPEKIMHEYVKRLLLSKDKDTVQCLCVLMATIGKILDHSEAKNYVDDCFNQIKETADNLPLEMLRQTWLLREIIDLRDNTWVPRPEEWHLNGHSSKRVMAAITITRVDNATIARILAGMAATDETRRQQAALMARLDTIAKRLYGPATRIDAFGSTVSGFAMRDSDLDITMNPNADWDLSRNEKREVIQQLSFYLCHHCGLQAEPVLRARVPIVKIKDRTTRVLLPPLALDLSVQNDLPIYKSQLLGTYSSLDERVRPLVMLVKAWAETCDINSSPQ